jgi:hypothetical protein
MTLERFPIGRCLDQVEVCSQVLDLLSIFEGSADQMDQASRGL